MNTSTLNDITTLIELITTSELEEDIIEKQDNIKLKASKGRQFMNEVFATGTYPIEIVNDNKKINEIILNLFHFRQYVTLNKHIFLNWEELPKSLSENLYIDMGNYVKKMNDDFDEDMFYDLIEELLIHKLNKFKGNANDENNAIKLFNVYHRLIGKEWLDAKMLKSLKGFV